MYLKKGTKSTCGDCGVRPSRNNKHIFSLSFLSKESGGRGIGGKETKDEGEREERRERAEGRKVIPK
jgi:hypothetical protein